VTETCDCGLESPRLRLLGRSKEVLWLFDGIKVPITSIEDAIKATLNTVPPYQVELERTAGIEKICVKIGQALDQRTVRLVQQAITTSTQELDTYVRDDRMDIHIRSVDESGFYRTERGKVPRIVDRRRG